MPTTYPTDPLCSQLSGSVGATTYGHNQYGPWVRARANPSYPATPRQTVIAGAMSTLTSRWATVLTALQRHKWDLYALAVSRPGTTGRQNNASGLPMYIRSNIPRIQANHPRLSIVDAAPILHDLGDFGPIHGICLDTVEDSVIFHFDDSSDWCQDLYAAMILWISPVKSEAVNFYKGPYQLLDLVKRKFSGPPTSPATVALPAPVGLSDRHHFRARVTRRDGRLSADQRFHSAVAAECPLYPVSLTSLGGTPPQWSLEFSGPLLDEPMTKFPWRLRWDNKAYDVQACTWAGSSVTLTATYSDPLTGPDYVFYLPTGPPPGRWYILHDATTRLAVPEFHYYP